MLTEAELKVNVKFLENPEVAEKVIGSDGGVESNDQRRNRIKLKTMHTLKILHKLL